MPTSHYQARHDALTGVLNPIAFERLVRQAFARAEGIGIPAALFIVDVGGLEAPLADDGRNAVDAMLCQTAVTLRNSVRACDVVARLGASEFAVLLNDCDEAEGRVAAARVLAAVESQPALTAAGTQAHVAGGGLVQWSGAIPDARVWLVAARAACGEARRSRCGLIARVPERQLTAAVPSQRETGRAAALPLRRRAAAPRASPYWCVAH